MGDAKRKIGPSEKPPPPKVKTRPTYQSLPYARDEIVIPFSFLNSPTVANVPVDRHPSKGKGKVPTAMPMSSETSLDTSTLGLVKAHTLSKPGTIPTVTEGSKVRDTRGFRSVTLPQTPSKNPTGGKTEVEKRSETGISLGSLVAHKEVTPHESDVSVPASATAAETHTARSPTPPVSETAVEVYEGQSPSTSTLISKTATEKYRDHEEMTEKSETVPIFGCVMAVTLCVIGFVVGGVIGATLL